ncbi:class B sortase [Irregularibacter muris]|uniref:Class B sortase n=1 Tax=Irregularibacter muris TaxID=1796619 RepID=A0AAE3HFT2_9FIRM|nr:class B sortase [Irregularibacter muris]MCR1898234.1 class B sortase [Irregularibacter muris]
MRKSLLILSIAGLLFSSGMIINYFYKSFQNKQTAQELSQIYHTPGKGEEGFKKLQGENQNIIGWIEIEGTKIDYPIVQGEDNDFYLTHDVEGKKSIHGSIFMDYRNDFSKDQNLIVYGHHMKDGTMFENLVQYKNKDFFDENREFDINLLGEKSTYEIFAISVLSGNEDYLKTSFSSKEEFLAHIQKLKDNAKFYRDIAFAGEEEIITLSTCSYEFKEARTVVHARKK